MVMKRTKSKRYNLIDSFMQGISEDSYMSDILCDVFFAFRSSCKTAVV